MGYVSKLSHYIQAESCQMHGVHTIKSQHVQLHAHVVSIYINKGIELQRCPCVWL